MSRLSDATQCTVMLQWTGGKQVQPLLKKVELVGAKPPKDFFYIRYFPQTVGKGRMCQNTVTMFPSMLVKHS